MPNRDSLGRKSATGTFELHPAIRVVQAFKSSVEDWRETPDSGGSTFAAESLMISALASFEGLARSIELCHEAAFGDPPADAARAWLDQLESYEAWESWLDGADVLIGRVLALDDRSERASHFIDAYEEARAALNEARDRLATERASLDAAELADLASRLEARRASPGPEGSLP